MAERAADVALIAPAGHAREHFDTVHAGGDDPWHVTSSWYEIRKRSITLATLPAEKYGRVLEIGCSIGVVTEALADRADDVLALDLSDEAVGRARLRLAARADVRVEQCDVVEGIPVGPFDLVVLSEVGYYLAPGELRELLTRIHGVLSAGGTLLACHWRHPESDFLQSGDSVHAIVRAVPGFAVSAHYEEADFVLDVLAARDSAVLSARDSAPVEP